MLGSPKYAICNMRGEPLMLLHEKHRFALATYEYELFRVDFRTGRQVPVCRVVRTRKHGHDIEFDAAAGEVGATHELGAVHCYNVKNGCGTSIKLNGGRAAQILVPSISWESKYDLTLSPNTDVLLFLGIACAIDLIRIEIARTGW
eukprot:UN1553